MAGGMSMYVCGYSSMSLVYPRLGRCQSGGGEANLPPGLRMTRDRGACANQLLEGRLGLRLLVGEGLAKETPCCFLLDRMSSLRPGGAYLPASALKISPCVLLVVLL